MRLAMLALVLLTACQRAEPPEEQARPLAPQPTSVVAASAVSPAEEMSCGGACGGACGGGESCGGSCGGGCGMDPAAKFAAAAEIPADAVWTDVTVRGMHCGGCARRIQRALTGIDGLYGCEVDLGTATVHVASAPGKDGRALASPLIAALGYQVAP